MNKPTFKHICLMHIQQLTNFPYIEKDFDALTDYGLLCKIVDYLNQVITNENAQNENIVALYNAFTELKNYVESFFDNLDVQDEINNKLDEMVEDGTLETIISKYIFDNEINVKYFGAKGDGVTDDTQSFIDAITYLKNQYTTNGLFNDLLTLTIPTGTYLITETIEIPFIIKIKLNGDVLILSDVNNASTFWINSGEIIKYQGDSNIIKQQSYNIYPMISGNGVLCIERNTEDKEYDVNTNGQSSIAIEIGDRTYNANYINCARTTFENIAISGFTTGIQLNTINTYLLNFNNIKLERNRYNFVYGKSGMTIQNSGENIKIINSTLAQSYNTVVINGGGFFNFDNCSFDFNGNNFLFNHQTHVVLNSPHIENVGFSQDGIINADASNCIGWGTIAYVNYNSSSKTDIVALEINEPDFYLASSNHILIPRYQSSFNGNYPNLYVKLNSLQYYNEGGYIFDNMFMNTKNVVISDWNTTMKNATMPTIPFNNYDNAGMLNNINNTLNSLDTLDNNYQISTQNVAGVIVDTTDKIFNKSLKFEIQSKNYENIRRRIKNINGKKLTSVAWIKTDLTGDSDTFDKLHVSLSCYFYNKQNIAVSDTVTIDFSDNHIFSGENGWLGIKPCIIDIPTGTDEIMINYSLSNRNANNSAISASGYLWFGGLVVDSLN